MQQAGRWRGERPEHQVRSDKPIIRASFVGRPTYSGLRTTADGGAGRRTMLDGEVSGGGYRLVRTNTATIRPASHESHSWRSSRRLPLVMRDDSGRYCGAGVRFFGRDFAATAGLGGTQFNAVPSLGSTMTGLTRGGALLLRD